MNKEENVSKSTELKLSLENNFKYLISLDKTKDLEAIGFFTNEHLKMSGNLNYLLSSLLLGHLSAKLNS